MFLMSAIALHITYYNLHILSVIHMKLDCWYSNLANLRLITKSASDRSCFFQQDFCFVAYVAKCCKVEATYDFFLLIHCIRLCHAAITKLVIVNKCTSSNMVEWWTDLREHFRLMIHESRNMEQK